MSPQNPKQGQGQQSQGQQGQSTGGARGKQEQQSGGVPRYDDRPDSSSSSPRRDREGELREENEGPAGHTTKSPEQRAKEAQQSGKKSGTGGLPDYGDRQPDDPRRSDVEGGAQGRRGGASEE